MLHSSAIVAVMWVEWCIKIVISLISWDVIVGMGWSRVQVHNMIISEQYQCSRHATTTRPTTTTMVNITVTGGCGARCGGCGGWWDHHGNNVATIAVTKLITSHVKFKGKSEMWVILLLWVSNKWSVQIHFSNIVNDQISSWWEHKFKKISCQKIHILIFLDFSFWTRLTY